MSDKGIHDIIGCYKGRFVSFETKTPENKEGLSQGQIEFMVFVKQAGGYSFEVRSVQDVIKAIKFIEMEII